MPDDRSGVRAASIAVKIVGCWFLSEEGVAGPKARGSAAAAAAGRGGGEGSGGGGGEGGAAAARQQEQEQEQEQEPDRSKSSSTGSSLLAWGGSTLGGGSTRELEDSCQC